MDDPQLQLRSAVAELYETHPYPPVGLFSGIFQRIRWAERQTLNYRALYAASYGSTEGAAARPRILVAGCGTFEPIVVALANPNAEIVAIDLSTKAINKLKQQAKFRGCSGRIFCATGDLHDLPESLGKFDLIIATGVIHHLPDPLAGLQALIARSADRAVFRFMIYSYWGRSLLYRTKALAEEFGVKTPRELRRLIGTLPASHPYRLYFHLYGDARTDAGLSDGYLHPCDQAFTARGLGDLLEAAGLRASLFLQAPNAQPEAAAKLAALPPAAGDWEKLAVLEAFGELEENFRFVARRADTGNAAEPDHWEWNEALPAKGRIRSTRVGKELAFDTSVNPSSLDAGQVRELARALLLVPSVRA